jgi:hypothetical protein
MVPVTLSMSAPDTCNVSCNLTSIAGTDGATSADWQITGPMSASLRATAVGRTGRLYKLALTCTDPATNLSAIKAAAVTVPAPATE